MADVDLNEYNGGRLLGATIALLVLSWVTIALRTYTRAVIMRSFMADDWLMLTSQVREIASELPKKAAADLNRLYLPSCAPSSLLV